MILFRWFFQLFWIGICAVAMMMQTALLMAVPAWSDWLGGFVFGATVFGYNFAAVSPLRWLAWIAGVASSWCFFNLSTAQQLVAAIPAFIWLFYYDVRRPGSGGLRKFPVLKPLAIALAWAWVTVLIPLPFSLWTGAGIPFVGRLAFIFALALGYDLCDLTTDRRQGFQTLVLQLGAKKALRIVDFALLVAAGSYCLNFSLHRYPFVSLLALLVSLVIAAGVIHWLPRQTRLGFWRKVGIDGLMVLQLALVWWTGK